jgi:vacuolar protein sorting-associated protein 13A/C
MTWLLLLLQVSFWRALPPPGYVTLGDCMVTGIYCPPPGVLVVRDTDPSEFHEGPPMLARPIGITQVGGRGRL